MSALPPPAHRRPGFFGLVAVGGAVGALARYGVSLMSPSGPSSLPWGTLIVNVIGAFILGVLLEAMIRKGPETPARTRLRLLLGTGFCGAFTTYSTFARDVTQLLDRTPLGGLGWALGEVALGVLAAAAGAWVATRTVAAAS